MIGKILYPWNINAAGCEPFTTDDFTEEEKEWILSNENSSVATFILVDRGFCSNPTKVRNIETFGGAMALIADYKPENMDDFVMMDHGGAGHSLQIPGFMIDYDSANKIKASLQSGANVMIRASLMISNPNNEIEIGLLYSSSLDLDAQSLEAFTTLAQKSAIDR